jgi:hypothetical protein
MGDLLRTFRPIHKAKVEMDELCSRLKMPIVERGLRRKLYGAVVEYKHGRYQ